MYNNKNISFVVLAFVLGVVSGYFLGNAGANDSNQSAQLISTEVADTSLSSDTEKNNNSSNTTRDIDGGISGGLSDTSVGRPDRNNFSEIEIMGSDGEKLIEGVNVLKQLGHSLSDNPDSGRDFLKDTSLAHGTKVFRGSAHQTATGGATIDPLNPGLYYSFYTCPVQTTTCPGWGQDVEIIIVGAGSMGVDGRAKRSNRGGAGGGGGGAGGYFRGIMTIPSDGSIYAFSGNLGRSSGVAETANNGNWGFIDYESQLTDFGMPATLKAHTYDASQNPITRNVLAVFGGKTSWCNLGICSINNRFGGQGGNIYIAHNTYNTIFFDTFSLPTVVVQPGGWGQDAGDGLLCSGSDGGIGATGWNTPDGVKGSGTKGGHGGYSRRPFQCLQHSNDYEWSRTTLPSSNSDSVAIFNW